MSMHKSTQLDEFEGARGNAKGWYETIQEQVAALTAAKEAYNGIKGGNATQDEESARETIQEGPLEVSVRDGWHSPGQHSQDGPQEFYILLSTGGPALRIYGTLGAYSEPKDCELQMQDWGTRWTKWAPEPHDETFHDTLLAYASCFYFGE